jgi:glycolate oxidase FAD binding subunit
MSTVLSDDPVLAGFAELIGDVGPIAVEGRRTRWAVGGELDAATRVVTAPAGIVGYAPEEMTVTVRAGTTVEQLHAALAERGQRSALSERGGTVGGALAVGENHLCVLGRGRLRAGVLQVRYVSAEGRMVRGGGPTVKNVTGFDLVRLMVGSLGTLGILADVTLRTNPIPPVSRWLRADEADPFQVRDRLQAPSAVLWNGSAVWVLLEGHGGDVAGEAGALRELGSFSDVDGPPAMPGHRWSMTPRELSSIPAAAGSFVAEVGVGVMHAAQPQPRRAVSLAVQELSARVKAEFDPTGRLNPGRAAWRR